MSKRTVVYEKYIYNFFAHVALVYISTCIYHGLRNVYVYITPMLPLYLWYSEHITILLLFIEAH